MHILVPFIEGEEDKKPTPKILDTDLTTYQLLLDKPKAKRIKPHCGCFRGYHRGDIFQKEVEMELRIEKNLSATVVTTGYRTIKNLEEAKAFADWYKSLYIGYEYIMEHYHLFECLIPKGSLYYEGKFNGDFNFIMSNNFKIIKRV